MQKIIALYARYSSDLQNDRSIEDQIQVCQKMIIAQRQLTGAGGRIEIYADRALSGAFLSNRKELLRLQNDIENGIVISVVTEALDRLSRDQEDIARFLQDRTISWREYLHMPGRAHFKGPHRYERNNERAGPRSAG